MTVPQTTPALDLDQLADLERAATPGPWCSASGPHRLTETGFSLANDFTCDDGDVCCNFRPYRPIFRRIGLCRKEDTDFVAQLRNAVPVLIAAARERDILRAELDRAHGDMDATMKGWDALCERSDKADDALAAAKARIAELEWELDVLRDAD